MTLEWIGDVILLLDGYAGFAAEHGDLGGDARCRCC